MARIRRTSMEALEDKIEKAQTDVSNAKRKYDEATAELKKLLDKRELSHGLMFLLTSGMIELLTDVKRIEL